MGAGAFRQRSDGLPALGTAEWRGGIPGEAGSEEPGSETIPSGAEDSSTASLVETARQAYLDQVEQVRSFLAARKEFLYGEWTG